MQSSIRVLFFLICLSLLQRLTVVAGADPVPNIQSKSQGQLPAEYDSAVDLRSNAMLGFCDGEFYVPKAKNTCSHGFNFGQRPPKCVCIRGAYQMYLDNCEVADGFADEVCTLLEDNVIGVKVKGIKLTKEINWKQLGVVCNRIAGQASEWDYIPANGRTKINHMTTSLYAINGQAMVSRSSIKGKSTLQLCVQQQTLEKVICLYRHVDNVDIWQIDKVTDVIVKQVCPETGEWKPLHTHKCFDPLTLFDSDCQVPCVKSNLMGKGYGDIESLDGIPNLEGNCTDPKGYFTHENKFIDRQLLMYMVLDQIRKPNDNRNITIGEPKTESLAKVYKTFDLVKNIAMKSCTHPYLKQDILEWAAKFFMFLHRANKLQYEIKMSDEDFQWIESILMKCQANITQITLASQNYNPHCPSGQQKATGYCKPVPHTSSGDEVTDESPAEDSSCEFNPVRLSPLYVNYPSKHHVPEYNWLFLDIVHMNCFAFFKESYRMFHILQQTYEYLFTTPIKDYWHFPRWDVSTKKSMLTVEADTIMWNAQICAQSVYHMHENKIHRLVRPKRSKYPARKKRVAELLSPSADVLCAKTKSDFKSVKDCGANKKQVPKSKTSHKKR